LPQRGLSLSLKNSFVTLFSRSLGHLIGNMGEEKLPMNHPAPKIALPLDGNLHLTVGDSAVSVKGPHRFSIVQGKQGYQPTSVKTALHLATDAHLENQGTILLSVAPLETLASAAPMESFMSRNPNAQEYGLLADAFPNNDPQTSIFAWYWRSAWHPQMIAKFKNGPAAGSYADFEVTPYSFVEHQPLQERVWYQLALTWDKTESRLRLYVNGVLCGTTSYSFRADIPRPGLYLGNTAMVFADLEIHASELTPPEIEKKWTASGLRPNPDVQRQLHALHTVQPKPKVDWHPDDRWALKFDQSLCREDDFKGWKQEGCLAEGYAMPECRVTDEGLLLQTPDRIGLESRVYFWSPDSYEGDLAVEFEFRPELNTGLALLVVQATGMQREDMIDDLPPRTTGAMGTIITDQVRNYHWEFFRRAVDVRGDIGTQVLIKNPWRMPMGMSARPAYVPGDWYKLLFVQQGSHLRVAINDEWLLDVHDNPCANNGPVFNCGRIGIRLMYQTRIRFRNLKVWNVNGA
jgi:hypothetical protein